MPPTLSLMGLGDGGPPMSDQLKFLDGGVGYLRALRRRWGSCGRSTGRVTDHPQLSAGVVHLHSAEQWAPRRRSVLCPVVLVPSAICAHAISEAKAPINCWSNHSHSTYARMKRRRASDLLDRPFRMNTITRSRVYDVSCRYAVQGTQRHVVQLEFLSCHEESKLTGMSGKAVNGHLMYMGNVVFATKTSIYLHRKDALSHLKFPRAMQSQIRKSTGRFNLSLSLHQGCRLQRQLGSSASLLALAGAGAAD